MSGPVAESIKSDPEEAQPGASQGSVDQASLVIVIKKEPNETGYTIETEGEIPPLPGAPTGMPQAPNKPGGTILLNSLQGFPYAQPGTSAAADKDVAAARSLFQVDTSRIRAVPENQQNDDLQGLGLMVYNQDDFEEDVMAQVDEAIVAEKREHMEKLLKVELKSAEEEMRSVKQELENMNKLVSQITPLISMGNKEAIRKLDSIRSTRDNKVKQMKRLKVKMRSLKMKLEGSVDAELDADDAAADTTALEEALGLAASVKETERERLIRTGEMTPFGSVTAEKPAPKVIRPDESKQLSDFEKYLLDQTKKHSTHSKKKLKKSPSTPSKQNLEPSPSEGEPRVKKSKWSKQEASSSAATSASKRKNLFDAKDKRRYQSNETDFSNYRSRKAHFPRLQHNFSEDGAMSDHEDYDDDGHNDEDRDYIPDEGHMLEEDMNASDGETASPKKKKTRKASISRVRLKSGVSDEDWEESDQGSDDASPRGKKKRASAATHSRDDGSFKAYQTRIKMWKKEQLKKKHARIVAEVDGQEVAPPSDEEEDAEIDGGFKVPGRIWSKLYKYQRTGVKWLWELHSQQAGGIVGDEMGLGKTIQIISFLAGLRHSKLKDKGAIITYYGLGPTLIVCPTTIMHQWIKEFHTWAPMFRVAVLHSSGSYTTSPDLLVRDIFESNGVLVTAYSGVLMYQDLLLDYDWHYVILDEGHKIRNPDAQITIASKKFRTSHRVILSGSPVQNNLKELWSLFDFVFPGKLGTLPDFMAHFSIPIVQGGYSNATQIQVQTAYKCACVLRDTINPYLLRRMKADVKLQLPSRNEQVLFCRLTDEQKDVYKEYLESKECNMILSGKFMVFPGLITLRKICNHPDLATGGLQVAEGKSGDMNSEEREYGYWGRAGKMQVVHSLLKLWHKQEHRVLLFTQSRQMLDIMETYIQHQEYTYMRMDGATTISARQPLINQFNSDPNIFVFLLTTRVGGLGVNLTGANRIIIYDPDWNPSTDTQARERAWRIGQSRQVTIYRLLTAGTIEEKIYHRQIFKQFLTNRVLKDPKQRRFFKSNDLYELFTLVDDNPSNSTETSAIFAGTGSDVRVKVKPRKMNGRRKSGKANIFDKMREEREADEREEEEIEREEQEEDNVFGLPPEKLKELRELARKLSQNIGQQKDNANKDSSEIAKESDANSTNTKDNETSNANDTSSDPTKIVVIEEIDDKTAAMPNENSISSQVKKEKGPLNGDLSAKPSTSTDGQQSKVQSKHKHEKHNDHLKHKHKKDKKKKKKKDAKVDGERIAYLAKADIYKTPKEKEETSMDDYVLKQLFKKSGVHSAIQHDKIMMSATPDYALVEAEADRVAKQAAKALKQSRSQCNSARSGIPTWTGQSGTIASAKPRFGQKKNTKLLNAAGPSATVTSGSLNAQNKKAEEKNEQVLMFDGSVAGNVRVEEKCPDLLSSAELLSRMRQRNHALLSGQGEDGASTSHTQDISPQELDLFTDIRNYIAFGCIVDGQASTSEILDQFRDRVPSEDSAQFKAMLSQLCDFHKIRGQGTWVLKPDFR